MTEKKMTTAEKQNTELQVYKKGHLPMYAAQNLADAEKLGAIAAYGMGGDKADMTFVILYGQEMGIPPMTAAHNIYLIPSQGKKTPFISSRLMAAMVRESGKCAEMLLEIQGEGADKICVAKGKRSDSPAIHTIEVKLKDAKKDNHNWKQHPDAMLRARAIGILCRTVWPEVILGMNISGEQHFMGEDAEPTEVENTYEVPVANDSEPPKVEEAPWKDKEPEEKPKKKARAKKKEEQPEKQAKEAPPEPSDEEDEEDGDEESGL